MLSKVPRLAAALVFHSSPTWLSSLIAQLALRLYTKWQHEFLVSMAEEITERDIFGSDSELSEEEGK